MSTKTVGRFHPDPDDDSTTMVKKFIIRNAILVISVLLAVSTLIIMTNVMNNRAEMLERQTAEILSLQQLKAAAAEEVDTRYAAAVRDATGGMDTERKASDDELVTELMETALTWKGMSAYLEARETVMRKYRFDEDSQFMKMFMPGEREGVVRTDPRGVKHYAYDKDISNSFESLETYVTEVDGDIYSYVAVVTMRTNSESGAASATSVSLLSYDVLDGRVTNMTASIAPGGVKRSG